MGASDLSRMDKVSELDDHENDNMFAPMQSGRELNRQEGETQRTLASPSKGSSSKRGNILIDSQDCRFKNSNENEPDFTYDDKVAVTNG